MTTGAYRADAFRSIALDGIERHAGWLKTSSDQVRLYVEMLSDRPSYETKAEDAMAVAEGALVEALEFVRAQRAEFQKLKVDGEKTE